MISHRQLFIEVFAIVLWLSAVSAGFLYWEAYESSPGGISPGLAPEEGVSRESWSMVMYAHPHCPCTRASLHELAEILHECPNGVDAQVVFNCPDGVPQGWERTESWDIAAGIPGVRVRSDPDGTEARRVGAETSGYAIVTDPAGRIVFRGGITRARGRSGDSAGRRAILALLRGEETEIATAPVFGCQMFEPDDSMNREGHP